MQMASFGLALDPPFSLLTNLERHVMFCPLSKILLIFYYVSLSASFSSLDTLTKLTLGTSLTPYLARLILSLTSVGAISSIL